MHTDAVAGMCVIYTCRDRIGLVQALACHPLPRMCSLSQGLLFKWRTALINEETPVERRPLLRSTAQYFNPGSRGRPSRDARKGEGWNLLHSSGFRTSYFALQPFFQRCSTTCGFVRAIEFNSGWTSSPSVALIKSAYLLVIAQLKPRITRIQKRLATNFHEFLLMLLLPSSIVCSRGHSC